MPNDSYAKNPPPPRETALEMPEATMARLKRPAIPPLEAPRKSRVRRVVETGLVLAGVLVVALSSVTLLGKSSSQKFSSVAMAICDRRADSLAGWERDSPVIPGVLGSGGWFADLMAADESTSAQGCGTYGGGGGGGGGGSANAPSAPLGQVASPPARPPTAGTANAIGSGQPAPVAVNALEGPPPAGAAAAGHAFVSSATMTVRVNGDTAAAVAEQKRNAMEIAANVGGGLFGEQSAFNGNAKATITLKVPSAQFIPVLNSLAALGKLQSQEVKTDEVTLQVIDLGSRITAATNGLDRTRGLLAKASSLGDVASLEADVNRRETELENLKGQQVALAQRVDLSTIVLTLVSSDPEPVVAVAPAPSEPKPLPGFLDGLTGGWKVFSNVGTVVLAGFGAALPFLPFIVAPFVVWRLARRRSIARTSPSGSAGATPAPTLT